MKEIEIKFQVENLSEVLEALGNSGIILGKKIRQKDKIYIPVSENMLPVKPGIPVLRIRMEEGTSVFTYKSSDLGKDLYLSKTEKELEIFDSGKMEEIIYLLGFKLIAEVDKVRQKAVLEGCEICIDEVDNLGLFVEIENISDEDPEKVEKELEVFAEKWGIKGKRVRKGYDVLMFEKIKE